MSKSEMLLQENDVSGSAAVEMDTPCTGMGFGTHNIDQLVLRDFLYNCLWLRELGDWGRTKMNRLGRSSIWLYILIHETSHTSSITDITID